MAPFLSVGPISLVSGSHGHPRQRRVACLTGPRLSRFRSKGLRSNTRIARAVGIVVGLRFGAVIWTTNTFHDVLAVSLIPWA